MPDPAAYFSWDAVVLDIGPYYVSQLVDDAGAGVRGDRARRRRTGGPGLPGGCAHHGRGDPRLRVRRPSHAHAEPRRGKHSHPPLEVYGKLLATWRCPTPTSSAASRGSWVGKGPWETVPLGDRPWSEPNFDLPFGTFANYRGAGVEDLVAAIVEARPHRADGERAAHVLDVLEQIVKESHAH